VYSLVTTFHSQLKGTPFIFETCPLTWRFLNLRQSSRSLDQSRKEVSKSDIIGLVPITLQTHCLLLCSTYLKMICWLFVNIFVLSIQQQGYCFGFVEFHSPNSMNSAIEVCPFLVKVIFSFWSISVIIRCCMVIVFILVVCIFCQSHANIFFFNSYTL
jgi:hypothetical protein